MISNRHIDLQTGITPPASGSAYLELDQPQTPDTAQFLIPQSPALKLSCTVHGPRPLPRSAPYSPHLTLTCYVKYAPFSTRHRRGWLRDPSEKDISTQLEAALRGVVIGERYPKTGVDVCITILEGEEDRWWGDETMGGASNIGGWGLLGVLSGCITVASAALVDAGIECIDLITGGTASIIDNPATSARGTAPEGSDRELIVLDPNPTEHEAIKAACVVGYIEARDELSLLWMRGAASGETSERLINSAVSAALANKVILRDTLLASSTAAPGVQ